jgi:hypothetical protein
LQELSAELFRLKQKSLFNKASKELATDAGNSHIMYTVSILLEEYEIMSRFFPLAVLATLTSIAFAADADGTWKGSISTIVGISECTINIKTEGEKISGTVRMDVFGADITNGRLNGSKVSFSVNMDFGTLIYEGVVSGDELKFIVSAPDGSYAPLNCKRQK